ncbi:MAG TPA: hypothetical protein VN203_21260 [Candidatus Acidoferrum sp.]|nr:hypothetical protein [Candidatus Acidoferrum sp.]
MAESELKGLLQAHPPTAGMSVRVHGDHLILGRQEAIGPHGQLENDDRVRLTKLAGTTYGLSIKRHTGRWERTPFAGTLQEMVDVILGCMQHLVAPY